MVKKAAYAWGYRDAKKCMEGGAVSAPPQKQAKPPENYAKGGAVKKKPC